MAGTQRPTRIPRRGGRVPLPVGRPVEVTWDTWGIPHIRARSIRDGYAALGYAMAQERLWQLDYMRRRARGELAEILGPSALASDRAMRTLDLRRSAERDLGQLTDEVADALRGLTAGINAWTEHCRNPPIEFDLLGYQPGPWRPEDSIAIWKYRWWTLSGRLDHVLLPEIVRQHLPPDLAAAFLATELGEETIVPGASAGLAPGGDPGEGSNNWVVGPSRTTTGRAVLCSDPHNLFAAPSQWYEAQLVVAAGGDRPDVDVIGAFYCGAPAVYLGRNRQVAWGVTSHVMPMLDLYVEQIDPADPGRYRADGGWRAVETREESIGVAGGEPTTLRIRRTERGPIADADSGLLSAAAQRALGDRVVSLRWSAIEGDSGLDAALALHRAASVDDVLAALRGWPNPPLNFVYATADGHIGYHVASHIPRRPAGGRGLRQADEPDHRWDGTIPFDALPHMADPARGWIATANNPPWPAGAPAGTQDQAFRDWYLGQGVWSAGYRMRRIRERLTAEPRIAPEQIAAIHGDVESARARDLVPALLRVVADSQDRAVRDAGRWLADWDFGMTTNSVAASVFAAFWDAWCAEIARARFPEDALPIVGDQAGAIGRRLLLGDDLGWFPSGTVAEHVEHALQAGLARLRRLAGPRPRQWPWGLLHTITFRHPLHADRVGRRLSTGPEPTSGDLTVRATGHGPGYFDPDGPLAVTSGSTYRLFVDFAQPGRAYSVSTLGQSAHPTSRHFRDQTRRWLENGYKPLWMDEADVAANAAASGTFLPIAHDRRAPR